MASSHILTENLMQRDMKIGYFEKRAQVVPCLISFKLLTSLASMLLIYPCF